MDERLWKECVDFHGHSCPGLAIGYRAAEIATEHLDIPLSRVHDEDLVCVAENDACGLDCIQCLLSCTIGKGNLVLRNTGKSAYSFFDRTNGRSIRLVLKPFSDKGLDRQDSMDMILNGPEEEVFDIKKPNFDVPVRAKIFESVECEECREISREDKIRLQNGRMLCADCFEPYDRG